MIPGILRLGSTSTPVPAVLALDLWLGSSIHGHVIVQVQSFGTNVSRLDLGDHIVPPPKVYWLIG